MLKVLEPILNKIYANPYTHIHAHLVLNCLKTHDILLKHVINYKIKEDHQGSPKRRESC